MTVCHAVLYPACIVVPPLQVNPQKTVNEKHQQNPIFCLVQHCNTIPYFLGAN